MLWKENILCQKDCFFTEVISFNNETKKGDLYLRIVCIHAPQINWLIKACRY